MKEKNHMKLTRLKCKRNFTLNINMPGIFIWLGHSRYKEYILIHSSAVLQFCLSFSFRVFFFLHRISIVYVSLHKKKTIHTLKLRRKKNAEPEKSLFTSSVNLCMVLFWFIIVCSLRFSSILLLFYASLANLMVSSREKKLLLLLAQIYQYIPTTITKHQQMCLHFIVRTQFKMNEKKNGVHFFKLHRSQVIWINFVQKFWPIIFRATINICCNIIDFKQTTVLGLWQFVAIFLLMMFDCYCFAGKSKLALLYCIQVFIVLQSFGVITKNLRKLCNWAITLPQAILIQFFKIAFERLL